MIELVVVMSIVALLSVLIIGAVVATRRMTTETKHRANLDAAKVAFERRKIPSRYYVCLSCNDYLGASNIMTTLQLTASSLEPTECLWNADPATPSYGVWVVGNKTPAFSAIEAEAGLTGQGKIIILVTKGSDCVTNIGYLGLPL